MFDELDVLLDRARTAAASGDLDTAIAALTRAAAQTHLDDHEYHAVLRALLEAFVRNHDLRSALVTVSYLASAGATGWDRAVDLLSRVPHADRASVLGAQGHLIEAAAEMEGAGLLGAAAVYRERAKQWAAARALWSRLAHAAERGADSYVAALIRFNLARCARACGDSVQAREASIASVGLLEEAADRFESAGQRERAFDCFQVLAQIGREGGSMEDVLEGSVNSIRMLREDRLKHHFALELFDELIRATGDGGETRAAATLARQAQEYAKSQGLASEAASYGLKQAQLWQTASSGQHEASSPASAENALLAAVVALAELGQYARVGAFYKELAELPLDASRREYYARAGHRYEGANNEPLSTASARAPGGAEATSAQVWHADVLEWERKGDPVMTCAEVALDRRFSALLRRKAMLAQLTALHVEAGLEQGYEAARMLDARVRLAEELGEIRLYAALAPLEKLFERPERPLKIAVLRALRALWYKRSFVTVRAGLRDADPTVVDEATRTAEALQFPHAIEPLSRILHESSSHNVRAAVSRALANLGASSGIDS